MHTTAEINNNLLLGLLRILLWISTIEVAPFLKGKCSWYNFDSVIMNLCDEKCRVKSCTSDKYKTPAKRPE